MLPFVFIKQNLGYPFNKPGNCKHHWLGKSPAANLSGHLDESLHLDPRLLPAFRLPYAALVAIVIAYYIFTQQKHTRFSNSPSTEEKVENYLSLNNGMLKSNRCQINVHFERKTVVGNRFS